MSTSLLHQMFADYKTRPASAAITKSYNYYSNQAPSANEIPSKANDVCITR